MTEKHNLERRTFMGTLAALSAGKATGVTLADPEQESKAGTNSEHLPDYANRVGRINHQGLNQAIDDWQNNVISRSELEQVKEAFRTGQRVVDKQVQELSENINSDTLLEKNPDDPSGDAIVYTVTSSISVNAELTIEAGVLMEFTQGTGLSIDNGSIKAEGTSSETIFMTATNARPGWYDGIYIQSGDLTNRIQNLTMEYGGRSLSGNISIATGAGDSGQLELSNSELRWSDMYGLYLSGSATLLGGSGENTYTANREGGVRMVTSNVHQLSPSSDFTGNDRDYVLVDANTLSGAGADEDTFTWQALNVPYRMNGYHNVDSAELVVNPGVTLEFTQQSTLDFNSSARITVEGGEEERITFTGTTERRGWWNGVYVQTTDTENTMYHTTVEYGANSSNNWDANLTSGTNAGDSGVIELQNSTFRQADGFGVKLGNGSDLGETQNNTYTENADGALYIGTENVEMLSETSTFTGNDNDYVLVTDRGVSGLGSDNDMRTWENIDVPYRLDGYHNVDAIELVINPGTTFEFTEQSALDFNSGARLTISGFDEDAPEGEKEKPITFTGTDQQRGWWKGIYIQTTDTENLLEEVIVEYGGADGWTGQLVMGTGAGDSGRVKIRRSVFREGQNYGVRLASGSDISGSELNEYTSNGKGALRIGTENIEMVSETSQFSGNDDDHVLVNGRGVSGDGADDDTRTWQAIDVPYRMKGYHNVDTLELEVNPGTEFRFTEQSTLDFNSGARITIQGTEDAPILFSGTQEERGWWDGIYIQTTDTENVMEWATVEYGGRNEGSGQVWMGTGAGDGATIEFNNCTFRESQNYGVHVGSSSNLKEPSNNTYTSNRAGAMRIGTENMSALSDSSDFTGNDNDHVLVNDRGVSGDGAGSDTRTWDGINVPYRMKGYHDVNNLQLEINPGATLEFTEQSALDFNSGSRMIVSGFIDETEETDEITFTGTQEQRGWWKGIYIQTTSRVNTFEYTTIEYGGASGWTGQIEMGTGAGDNGLIENLNNCTFRNADGYGIYVVSNSKINNASGNVYTNNVDGAARMQTDNVHNLSASSDFTGNDSDYVHVEATRVNADDAPSGQDSVTWENFNVPYRMIGGDHGVQGVGLTIEAGTTLEFEEDGQLYFDGTEAVMDIVGTDSDQITFTASPTGRELDAKGWWDGIYIDSDSAANQINQAVIEYGGRDLAGNVTLGTGAGDVGRLTLQNSTLRYSQTSGLYVDEDSFINSDVCDVNTFSNNNGEDCSVNN